MTVNLEPAGVGFIFAFTLGLFALWVLNHHEGKSHWTEGPACVVLGWCIIAEVACMAGILLGLLIELVLKMKP